MKNSEIKNENQVILFDMIQKTLPANYALVDVVSELLGVGTDATYRRMRGDKPISFEETVKLCKHFNISVDLLIKGKNIHQFDCIYRPINLSKPDEYQNYILALLENFEKLKTYDDSSILISAMDIPSFYLLFYKELILFKLYAWSHSVYNYEGCFDDFIKEIETPVFINCHQKISNIYEFISSAEIWTENTINITLRLISYYFDINCFSSKELPLLMCEQILKILGKLQKWAESGYKGEHKTPFQLYLSEIDLESTYVLMKHSGIKNVFTVNNLNIFDKEYCNETENYLNKLAQRSVLLCGVSEKERIKFFKTQQQKVLTLMEKIQNSF